MFNLPIYFFKKEQNTNKTLEGHTKKQKTGSLLNLSPSH